MTVVALKLAVGHGTAGSWVNGSVHSGERFSAGGYEGDGVSQWLY